MKFISCIVIVTIYLFSCKSINFIGTYASNKSPYQLVINSDNTFTYQYRPHEFSYKFSTGFWKEVKRGMIELQSIFKDRSLILNVIEENIATDNGYSFFNIQTNIKKEQQKYYECIIYADGEFATSVKCDSLEKVKISLPRQSIVIKITADERLPSRMLDTLSSEKYFIKNSKSNLYTININLKDSFFNYKVFNKEVIKIKKNRIVYNNFIIPLLHHN